MGVAAGLWCLLCLLYYSEHHRLDDIIDLIL